MIFSEESVTGNIDLGASNGINGMIVDANSPLGGRFRTQVGELILSFETASAFTEFDPIFDSLLDVVDVRDPATLAAAIRALGLDLSVTNPEFLLASELAIETLNSVDELLEEAFDSVNAFTVRADRTASDLAAFLAGAGLLVTVDQDATQFRQALVQRLDRLTAAELVGSLEQLRAAEYGNHWGVTYQVPVVQSSVGAIQTVLQAIAQHPGKSAAVIYAFLHGDDLELTLVLPEGPPQRHTIQSVGPDLLQATVQLRRNITNPLQSDPNAYLSPGQALYQWLLEPFRDTLDQSETELLLFSLDAGLRSLPVAALHDGEAFLIENYAVAIIPSFALLDTQYQPLTDATVLVAGASRFDALGDLPAVPAEVAAIQDQWSTVDLVENEFTLNALRTVRQESMFAIAHLATHAFFRDGDPSNSFVQLWGSDRLTLDAISSLNFHRPPLELLVLSACQTAFGDTSAELGFAGLSVQSGAKSVVASLWQVSDTGTLALMSEFYSHLSTLPTKADSLRQAQLAMLHDEIRTTKGRLARQSRGKSTIPQPFQHTLTSDFTHPYFWAGFTLVGSPW